MLALLGYTGVVAFGQFTSAASSDAVGSLLGQLPGNQQSIAGVLDSLPQSVSGFGQFGQLSQLQGVLSRALGALATVSNGLLHLTLALIFAFFPVRRRTSLGVVVPHGGRQP